jgi:hypothetical protein
MVCAQCIKGLLSPREQAKTETNDSPTAKEHNQDEQTPMTDTQPVTGNTESEDEHECSTQEFIVEEDGEETDDSEAEYNETGDDEEAASEFESDCSEANDTDASNNVSVGRETTCSKTGDNVADE